LHITPADFDFESSPLCKEDFVSEIERSKVYSATTKLSLVEIFLALCALAVSLTEVIMVVYPSNKLGSLDEVNANRVSGSIESCKYNLYLWFEKTTPEFPTPAGLGDTHESVILYTNLMYVYYHSGMLALYHREILMSAIRPALGGDDFNQISRSKRQVEEAAANITDSLKELVQLKLAKYLPISVVAYATLPLVLHILDVKLSTTDSQTARKQGRLNIYTEAMKAWQLQYDGTDQVSCIIGKMFDHVTLESETSVQVCHINGSAARKSLEPVKSSKAVHNWGDILLRQPGLYLRLALTVDFFLCKGRFPVDTDFPTALQSQSQTKTHFPLYRITMEDTPVEDAPERSAGVVEPSLDSNYIRNDIDLLSNNENKRVGDTFLSNSLLTPTEGTHEQMHVPLDPFQEHIELPLYSNILDIEMLDDGSSLFENPAAWTSGMF